mmetsp:Transcript_29247/g.27999  ORF Transcript_29247/g.27999 Transcript_29247/m.27999 type:complete len:176 (-) Transcript_29247:147-674(-)
MDIDHETNNDDSKYDDEDGDNEMICNPELPRAILKRNANKPNRFLPTPAPPIRIKYKFDNKNKRYFPVPIQKNIVDNCIPNDGNTIIPFAMRHRAILAVNNHIMNINVIDILCNINCNNVNYIEEDIDVAPVARLSNLRVAKIDEIQPYVANPLRRVNALLAIHNLMKNELILHK